MKSYILDPNNPVQLTEEELQKIDEIALQRENDPAYYEDCPEVTDEFFNRAKRVHIDPFKLSENTIRLDDDVMKWLKILAHNRDYNQVVNGMLRNEMMQMKKNAAAKRSARHTPSSSKNQTPLHG